TTLTALSGRSLHCAVVLKPSCRPHSTHSPRARTLSTTKVLHPPPRHQELWPLCHPRCRADPREDYVGRGEALPMLSCSSTSSPTSPCLPVPPRRPCSLPLPPPGCWWRRFMSVQTSLLETSVPVGYSSETIHLMFCPESH
uniref:Uncharacterized protein n=1 Tax=Triticum urartu TaxID=4572 RepID=A0A8R7UA35_TRIUA